MHRQAYLLLLLTMLFWACNAIAGKLAIGHVSPMVLTAARWSLALLLLLVFGRKQIAKDWPLIRENMVLLFGLGALGFTVFSVALYCALLYTSAINVSIEQGGMPLFVFIGAYFLFRTRVSIPQLLGFGLSFAGVVITATHGEVARLITLDLNFGDALMLLAILAYGIYTAALRLKPDIHWMSLMAALCMGAVLSSIPFVVAEAAYGAMILPDARGWAIILFIALFPSLIAQVFYIRGVELIGANRAGLFINFLPLWGAFLSVTIIGDEFHAYHALALVMVLGGILIAEYSARKRAAA